MTLLCLEQPCTSCECPFHALSQTICALFRPSQFNLAFADRMSRSRSILVPDSFTPLTPHLSATAFVAQHDNPIMLVFILLSMLRFVLKMLPLESMHRSSFVFYQCSQPTCLTSQTLRCYFRCYESTRIGEANQQKAIFSSPA